MDTYALTESFERQVIWHIMTSALMLPYLPYLEDCYFSCMETRTLAKAARAFNLEHGLAPGGVPVVLQRVEREVNEGRLAHEDQTAVEDWVWQNFIGFVPNPAEAVVAEFGVNVRARAQFLALDNAVKQSRSRADLSPFAAKIVEAAQIGRSSPKGRVLRTMEDLKKVLNEAGDLDRLSTGVHTLNALLDGGLARGAMGLILASTGVGKSQLLIQLGAAAMIQGKNVSLVLLEGTEAEATSRLLAVLSGLTLNDVRCYQDEAIQVIADRWPGLGQFAITSMEATGSLSTSIVSFWNEEAQKLGQPFDLYLLDYVDCVSGVSETEARSAKASNDYHIAKAVMRHLSDYIKNINSRLWTPIASKRLQKGVRQDLDINDGADSQHKVRIADVVLALNKLKAPPATATDGSVLPDADVMIEASVLKHRQGRSDRKSSPIKTDMDRAIVFPDATFFPPHTEPL